MAMRLIMWLGSHESSHMIAHLCEHFLKIIIVLQVYYLNGNFITYDDIMQRFPIFLNFSWPFQNAVETAGMTVPT